MTPNRRAAGRAPSSFAATSSGAELGGRPRSFISAVEEIVIATVPAAPATSPRPSATEARSTASLARVTTTDGTPDVPAREPLGSYS